MASARTGTAAGGARAALAEPEQPSVLHAGAYHVAVTRALFEAERLDGARLLAGPAAELAYRELLGVEEEGRVAAAEEVFRTAGLGRLDLSGTGLGGGVVAVHSSLVAEGWRARHGEAAHPVCATAAGFIAGSMEAAFGRPFEVEEIECSAHGASPVCLFRATPAEEGLVPVSERESFDVPASRAVPADPHPLEARLAAALAAPAADAEGRIAGFGVPRSRVWAEYFPRVAYRFERQVPRVMGPKFTNLPALVLTEAAHAHGYHGLGGALCSDEWAERVTPLLTTREDWLHAAVALIDSFGWGVWRVQSIVPGESLSIRVHHSHEALAYRSLHERATAPKCYLARGTAAALMNLLYVGDITERPEFSGSHYNDLFRSPLSFRAVETRCVAMDDPYCELVVNPLSPNLGARLRELLER
ncbi:MAG TPA: V4R domain-containing protein [Longimicrobiaceae bacterium]|nr:V4R domain-containing protein [Longimicrobiaceae bacterium]